MKPFALKMVGNFFENIRKYYTRKRGDTGDFVNCIVLFTRSTNTFHQNVILHRSVCLKGGGRCASFGQRGLKCRVSKIEMPQPLLVIQF